MKKLLATLTFALVLTILPFSVHAADFSIPTPSPYGASIFSPLEQQGDLIAKFFGGKFRFIGGKFSFRPATATTPTTLADSLLFSAASSQYLNRTFAAGNQKTWTWSAWVKRGAMASGGNYQLFGNYIDSNTYSYLAFESDSLRFSDDDSGLNTDLLITTQVFRDPSAWYHIVLSYDTTQATAANRIKLYINGAQVTSFSSASYPSQNYTGHIDQNTGTHKLANMLASYFDGYMSDVYFIDGQALTPGSFAVTDGTTGQWEPIAYKGTYGTNGFHLPFTNGASLGADTSGNGNTWTLNGGITAAANQVTDSPTNNYPTMSPLDSYGGSADLSQANLFYSISTNVSGFAGGRATQGVSSGKWYWEMKAWTVASTRPNQSVGVDLVNTGNSQIVTQTGSGNTPYSYVYSGTGNKVNNSVSSAYGAAFTTNDVIGVALDLNAGTLTFYKNGVSQGTAFSGLSGTYAPSFSAYTDAASSPMQSGWYANFGQKAFAYTPPTGFSALSTANLPTPTIKIPKQYFDILTYAGDTQPTRTITGLSFQPNFVWIKDRGNANWHGLFDSVRGPNYTLYSNLTNAEDAAGQYGYVSAFNTNGFTIVRSGSSGIGVVNGGGPYVAWNWKAGGAAVTNTAGSVTSQVSANPADGVSVVTWTGPASAIGYTVGHGLGTSPAMIILKDRGGVSNWWVWHKSLSNPAQSFLQLDLTAAAGANASAWNNTAPTSAVFSLLSGYIGPSTGQSYVAYVFAEVPGFSKFGSYTGNGSADGPFVYTGFRPRYIMWKDATNTYGWEVRDTARDSYNQATAWLAPNLSNAEAADAPVDILSNGFKIRAIGTTYTATNQSGDTFIYAAFAESPFKYANAR